MEEEFGKGKHGPGENTAFLSTYYRRIRYCSFQVESRALLFPGTKAGQYYAGGRCQLIAGCKKYAGLCYTSKIVEKKIG